MSYVVKVTRKIDNKEFSATFNSKNEANLWKISQLNKGDKCPFGVPEHEKLLPLDDVPNNATILEKVETYEPRLDYLFNPIYDENGDAILDKVVKCKVKIPAEFVIEEYETLYNENQLVQAYGNLRKDRDNMLRCTDFTQLADAPLNSEQKNNYREYRKFLRELPSKHNDSSILNAKVPTFEEFILNKR